MNLISSDLIKLYAECFEYAGGKLFWKTRPDNHFSTQRERNRWNTRYSGKEAGSLNKGYMQVKIFNKFHKCHRVAYALFFGAFIGEIDHVDGNKSNNKIENLRLTTRSQNCCNVGLNSSNTSGVKGVSFREKEGVYVVQIGINNKRFNLGRFKNLDDAKETRRNKAELLHKEFVNHG